MATRYEIKRSKQEVDEQVDKTYESTEKGTARWPAMTYEEGVQAALQWVIGDSDDAPIQD